MRQSRDRFAFVLGSSLVAITFFLVLDIQSGLNLSGNLLPIPDTRVEPIEVDSDPKSAQKELQSNENGDGDLDTFGALKRNFGFNFEQIGKLRNFIGSRSNSFNQNSAIDFDASKDHFYDLQRAVDSIDMAVPTASESNVITPTLGSLLSAVPTENSTILDKFNYEIKQNELYSDDSHTVDDLIREMATRAISYVEEKKGGTQIKMTMEFDNGMLALAKPMRFPREQQTFHNLILYADFERHTADIAAFHLDRVLGFRRAFPVTGRILNITSELYNLSVESFRNTFFISLQPRSEQCFYGTCRRYCDPRHPICGHNGLIETSFIAFFPVYLGVENDRIMHPWRKAYTPNRKAIWERDPKYCQKVKTLPPYNRGRRLFDLMDMAIFDFLSGNMDRHHYETIKLFGDDTFTIHYDNGRGFGRPFYDELANLAPLVQCCMIRSSTLKSLLRFHNGPTPLSQLMRESMASDPVAPVLWQPHLDALDRRVGIILTALRNCMETRPVHDVVYPRDEF